MVDFVKYMHIERLGGIEVEGILDGIVYIFPKIDGTNGQIWWEPHKTVNTAGTIRCGSRNRELSIGNDNAGFMSSVIQDDRYQAFFNNYPTLRLYGEWLVPHSLKTYEDHAWRRFYVFDVYDDQTEEMLLYDAYKEILDPYGIEYIPPLMIMKNPTEEQIYRALEKCGQFLVKDGAGLGEGITIKNYDWKNKHGRQTWAKIITNEFKTIHHKEMGAPLVNGSKLVEEDIVEQYVTEHFILKEQAKIVLEEGEWNNKLIPKLLGVVFHELITEEIWNILKKHKNPKINFSLLNKMTTDKVKKVIGL